MKDKNSIKPLKVRDKSDKFTINAQPLWSMNMRLLICGPSGTGKSSILTNIFLNDNLPYKKYIDGSRVFIFSPTIHEDIKLSLIVSELEVPNTNLFTNYNDDLLNDIFQVVIDDFKDAISQGQKPSQSWFIFDDLISSGLLAKKFSSLSKMYTNSRKYLCNIFTLSQAYTAVSKTIRLNCSGMVIFNTSNRELELIERENNYLKGGRKAFFKLFRSVVQERFQFLAIVYSNPFSELYLDSNFEPVKEI